ncbi:hypothetical protein ACJJTC_000156 [Scirpophaga incertulas]
MEIENITFRKKRRSVSMCNVSHDSSLFDATMVSLPNTSFNETQNITELNEIVKRLTVELQSAHQEIENLSSETKQLKSELEKSQKIIDTYKKVQSEPAIRKSTTPFVTRRKKQIKKDVIFTHVSTPEKICTPQKQSSPESRPSSSSDHNYGTLITGQSDIIARGLRQHCLLDTPKPTNAITVHVEAGRGRASSPVNDKPGLQESMDEVRKIIVFADEQGRGIRKALQDLVGSKYSVQCFWKPGARFREVIKWKENILCSLTKKDIVIVLGGINDRNPYEFQCCLWDLCKYVSNTNAILLEIPYNKHLRIEKLNYELRFTLRLRASAAISLLLACLHQAVTPMTDQ